MKHALLALALLAAPLAAPAQAADAMIVMKNFDFSPMDVTVSAGSTVTWKNMDGEPHTVVSADGLFRSSALDLSNRPYLIWKVEFTRDKLGEMDTELFKEWFQAFAHSAGMTLHVETLYGENNHHIVESCFKGLARALRQAVAIDPRRADAVPSTKGVLGGSL